VSAAPKYGGVLNPPPPKAKGEGRRYGGHTTTSKKGIASHTTTTKGLRLNVKIAQTFGGLGYFYIERTFVERSMHKR